MHIGQQGLHRCISFGGLTGSGCSFRGNHCMYDRNLCGCAAGTHMWHCVCVSFHVSSFVRAVDPVSRFQPLNYCHLSQQNNKEWRKFTWPIQSRGEQLCLLALFSHSFSSEAQSQGQEKQQRLHFGRCAVCLIDVHCLFGNEQVTQLYTCNL